MAFFDRSAGDIVSISDVVFTGRGVTANLDVTVTGTQSIAVGLDIDISVLSADLDILIANTEDETADTDVLSAFSPVLLTAAMDMIVSDGGAASQLFELDTSVSTPIISGPHTVVDPAVGITFSLFNLDDDVVSIVLGPSAVGVTGVSSFVNNGDGTGSFQADFDSTVASRYLTLIAIDDVDNESNETILFIVNSLDLVSLGTDFTIQPQATISTTTCDSLIDNIPETEFILKRQFTIPYSFNTTTFELRAVTPGSPVQINVVRRGVAGESDETQTYHIIPNQEITLIDLRLGRGTNLITAADNYGRSETIVVAATTYAAVLCTYAREIYNFSQVLVEEQENAIASPVSTRLAEPLITFPDLLPDVKSQQVLATKLAVRSIVNSPGRQSGVRDLLTGITLSTPIFVEENNNDTLFEPAVFPLFNNQESFAGVDAHVWPANECVRHWLAFIRYINNIDVFKVLSITENEVIFKDENDDLRRHVFDFTQDECSLTNLALQSICFEDIDVLISMFGEMDLVICAPTYPLDLRPVAPYPIHPIAGEQENVGGLDPGFDGYVGFSFTDHWDGRTPLDSQGPLPSAASGLANCVYQDGYLTVPLLLGSDDAQIDEFINATITGESQPGVAVSMDVSTDLAGIKIETPLDINISLPQKQVDLDMLVAAQIDLEVGLSIAISA